jgi:hypothetical protein
MIDLLRNRRKMMNKYDEYIIIFIEVCYSSGGSTELDKCDDYFILAALDKNAPII